MTRCRVLELGAEDVKPFRFASSVNPAGESVDLRPGRKGSFRTSLGAMADTDYPVTKAAFLVLGECWPRAIDLTALFDSAKAFLNAAANSHLSWPRASADAL